jgi:pilus assembly protein CpaE
VIVNRFQQRMFSGGLRMGDLDATLGEAFAAAIPNDYALVREAIDRGVPLEEVKPGTKVTQQMKKCLLPNVASKTAAKGAVPLLGKLRLSAAG